MIEQHREENEVSYLSLHIYYIILILLFSENEDQSRRRRDEVSREGRR